MSRETKGGDRLQADGERDQTRALLDEVYAATPRKILRVVLGDSCPPGAGTDEDAIGERDPASTWALWAALAAHVDTLAFQGRIPFPHDREAQHEDARRALRLVCFMSGYLMAHTVGNYSKVIAWSAAVRLRAAGMVGLPWSSEDPGDLEPGNPQQPVEVAGTEGSEEESAASVPEEDIDPRWEA